MLSPALSVLALLAGLSFTCSQNAEAGEPLTSSDAFSRDLPGAVVHVGVFGLFHPRQLRLSAPDGHALILHAGEERLVLEKSSGVDSANLSVSEKDIAVTARTRVVHALRSRSPEEGMSRRILFSPFRGRSIGVTAGR